MIRIRLWDHKKTTALIQVEKSRDQVQEAQQSREAAERSLASAKEKQEHTDQQVGAPLRRTRKEMLETNHVTDTLRRWVREGGH